jgi:hypothetical protein
MLTFFFHPLLWLDQNPNFFSDSDPSKSFGFGSATLYLTPCAPWKGIIVPVAWGYLWKNLPEGYQMIFQPALTGNRIHTQETITMNLQSSQTISCGCCGGGKL